MAVITIGLFLHYNWLRRTKMRHIAISIEMILFSSIRSSTFADTFRRLLETHCFQQAYCSL